MRKLFWLDLEMTGLDVSHDRILEAAAIVTDLQFNTLATYVTAVHQPQTLLDNMDDWCKDTHGKSGLVQRVIKEGISEEELDNQLSALADLHFPKEKIILCGNSIGQDKKFVDQYLPKMAGRLHHRTVDVSSFKVIFENLYGIKFKKEHKHIALDDIVESIGELRHYLTFLDPTKIAQLIEPQ